MSPSQDGSIPYQSWVIFPLKSLSEMEWESPWLMANRQVLLTGGFPFTLTACHQPPGNLALGTSLVISMGKGTSGVQELQGREVCWF